MNINFARVDADFIKNIVEDGYYSNATEAVRDAVRQMRKSFQDGEDKRHDRLMAALEEGEAAFREGRTVPYTPQFLDECEARARENIANGIKPNPDVCP